MDKVENIVPTVLIDAADKFVRKEKELSQGRNERFRNRVLKTARRALNRYIFFGVCIIVIFVTILLLNRSKDGE